jgi:SAM-dependent methyltransferase
MRRQRPRARISSGLTAAGSLSAEAAAMANTIPHDKSNGYEQIAETFMRARNPRIGPVTVREWSKPLPPATSILDLGCGYGVPISQVLIDQGFVVYGVDASLKLITAFRERFPNACAECAPVEDSEFFRRTFDGILAWGLMFLLPPDVQAAVIGKVARALNPGGRFLFTSPKKAITWSDAPTGRTSISLGVEGYEQILRAEGLVLVGEAVDEGENYYYFVSKPR